jgi:signal transduction histidine kinase
MKQKLIGLSRRYVTALRRHLEQGPCAGLSPALSLGRRAVALGLETLDMARIHERAVAALELASKKDGFLGRARIFFTEAIAPIEQTHLAARKTRTHLHQLTEMLDRRTVELAATNRQLQRDILRRKSVEADLKESGKHYARLLKESLQLQEGLRQLTHQVLAAREKERASISRELQDEIAQTLLGINVRMLSLKQAGRINTRGLKNEIADAQQLVAKSAQSVRQAARKFRNA